MESRLKAGGEGSSPKEWKVLAAVGLAEGRKATKFFVYCDGGEGGDQVLDSHFHEPQALYSGTSSLGAVVAQWQSLREVMKAKPEMPPTATPNPVSLPRSEALVRGRSSELQL